MTMSLFVVPMICEPLVGQPIDVCINQKPHLKGFELPDLADKGSKLRVDIVTGAVSKSTGGPTAIHTKFVWSSNGREF